MIPYVEIKDEITGDVILRFENESSQYDCIPLISRSMIPPTSGEKILTEKCFKIRMTSFVTGCLHSEVMGKLCKLYDVFCRDSLRFCWFDGEKFVANATIHSVTNIDEPGSAKETDSDWSISFEYCVNVDPENVSPCFRTVFTKLDAELSENVFEFDLPPVITLNSKSPKGICNTALYPSGVFQTPLQITSESIAETSHEYDDDLVSLINVDMGCVCSFKLEGCISADDSCGIIEKMDEMSRIFKGRGRLDHVGDLSLIHI